jgi:hypothetical protein
LWTGWPVFLGTIRRKRNADYAEYSVVQSWASELAEKVGIKTAADWADYWKGKKMPDDKYPKNPPYAYGPAFKTLGGWGAFLGTKRSFMTYIEAMNYIQKFEFNSYQQYRDWAKTEKRPSNFPSHPQMHYKDSWESFPVFLGYEKTNIDNLNQALQLLDKHDYIYSDIEGLYVDSDYNEVIEFISSKNKDISKEIETLVGNKKTSRKDFLETFLVVATA